MRVPLRVRLKTARGFRDVTKQVRDLTFRSIVPGGFASCTVSLHRPLTIQPDEIGYYGRLYVVDSRNGLTACEGRLEDPGRSAGRDGAVWNLTAIGPSAHAKDITKPVIYVDKQVPNWSRLSSTLQEVDTDSNRQDSDTAPGWRIQIRQGSTITTIRGGVMGGIEYVPISAAGQKLARISFGYDMGLTAADWLLRFTFASLLVSPSVVASIQWTTSAGSLSKVIGTDWVAGKARPELTILRQASTYTATDDTAYAMITALVVQATRYNAAGTELTTGASYTTDTIPVSSIVADAVGRLCPQFDGANASIASTTHLVDQLAYPDGVTAEKILQDMMALESGYLWEALESNSDGKYRFNWRQWPTSIRYEADVRDGYDSTGSADGLYDAVRVRYRNEAGQITTVRRTQTVQALTDAGLTREAFIDLGDEVGSQANAERAGDQFLLDHAQAPNAGRLVVSRPILDRQTGRMVMPWEIRPGYLVRVRGIVPRPDALNATGRDGVTVFRIVGTEFRASDASVVLELDSFAPTLPRLLAGGPYVGRPVVRPGLPRRR